MEFKNSFFAKNIALLIVLLIAVFTLLFCLTGCKKHEPLKLDLYDKPITVYCDIYSHVDSAKAVHFELWNSDPQGDKKTLIGSIDTVLRFANHWARVSIVNSKPNIYCIANCSVQCIDHLDSMGLKLCASNRDFPFYTLGQGCANPEIYFTDEYIKLEKIQAHE